MEQGDDVGAHFISRNVTWNHSRSRLGGGMGSDGKSAAARSAEASLGIHCRSEYNGCRRVKRGFASYEESNVCGLMAFVKQLLEVMQRACLMEALSIKQQRWLLMNANY